MATHSEKRQTAEERLKKSQEELARLGRTLLAGDGKALLDILEDMYYKGTMTGQDPYDTYRKLGCREVVDFLIGLRDKAKET